MVMKKLVSFCKQEPEQKLGVRPSLRFWSSYLLSSETVVYILFRESTLGEGHKTVANNVLTMVSVTTREAE